MRRWLLALAVAAGAGWWARRRWRSQWDDAVRTIGAVLLLPLLLPLDWLDDAWGWVSGIPGAIWDAISRAAHAVVDWAFGLFRWTWGMVEDGWRWVSGLFDAVWRFAQSVFDQLYGWAKWTFDQLWRILTDAVGALWRGLDWLFSAITSWVGQLVGALWDFANGIVGWVIDNVFAPLWDAVMWVWHEVVEPAVSWLVGLLGDVWSFVTGLARWAFDQIGAIGDFVYRYALGLLQVVEKALGWLLYFATHPFTWFTDMVDDVFQRAPGWLMDGLVRGLESEGDRVERFLADWIG